MRTQSCSRLLLAVLLLFAGLGDSSSVNAATEEILSLSSGNWVGDPNTAGGLDAGLAGDNTCLVASGDGVLGFATTVSLPVTLTNNYSRQLKVALWIGYRTNTQQAKAGHILWDGKPISSCYAYGAAEQLLMKKIVVSTSDFDFSAGAHTLTINAGNEPANATDFLEIDAIKIAAVGTYHGNDPAPAENWLIVTGGETTTPESDQVAKLASEMTVASGKTVSTVAASQLTEAQKASNNLILVGRYVNNSVAMQVLDANGMSNPFGSDAAFVQQQGYVAGVYPGAVSGDRKVILAIGWNQLGTVYGMSHLRTHLQYSNGRPYLDVEGSPNSFVKKQDVRKPDLEERGVYYNIAYGISYGQLTTDNWNDATWQLWIDKLVCAQLTHVYFFLWGNIELYWPKSATSNTIRNRVVHQYLKNMIDYAHRRGLKVTYQFSPTHIPADTHANIIATVPNAKGVYATYNDSFLCPGETHTLTSGSYSWPNALEVMKDVYGNEIEQFKQCDGFNLWFYDPGGCFCEPTQNNCKNNQAARCMTIVDAFSQIVQQKNPNAKFTVVGWPMWVLEPMYGISYRNTLLTSLKTYFQNSMDRVSWLDSLAASDTTLVQAKAQGFRLNGFVYWSNLETGYPFYTPMLNFLKEDVGRSATRQVQAIHHMRIEEGSKYPNTFCAAQLFWDRDQAKETPALDYSRWIANTNAVAADKIYQALILLDSFMGNGTAGQNHETKGAQIQTLIEEALALLPAAKQTELEWLLTTSRAMALLGKAVENPSQVSALTSQYVTLLNASNSFKACAPYGNSVFPTYVNWISTGWNNAPF